jgi:hypothetical protein
MNLEIITTVLTILLSLTGVGTTAYYVAKIGYKGLINARDSKIQDLQDQLGDMAYEYRKTANSYSNKLTEKEYLDQKVLQLEAQLAERRFSYSMCTAEMLFWRGKFQLSEGDDAMNREREKWIKLYRMHNNHEGVSSSQNQD